LPPTESAFSHGTIVVLLLKSEAIKPRTDLKEEMLSMRKIFINKMWFMALLLTASMAGCGGEHNGGGTPGTGAVCEGANCVSLGTAGDLGAAGGYAILAKDGVSTVPKSVVTGNIGLSPTARIGLTGWSETAAPDASDIYSTSAQVVTPYKLYAGDDAVPTPAKLTTAVLSMETAYTDASGRAPTSAATTNVGGGTLTDLTLAPGVYEWGTTVNIPTNLTLNGSATDIWIFKVAGTLDMAAAKNVILSGGALPQNIFWQVSGAVTIGANSHFEGIILGQTSITFGNLASINGRLLAQSAVILDATTVTQP
jgi:Ice-binding-like